jgi:hypothetical protein
MIKNCDPSSTNLHPVQRVQEGQRLAWPHGQERSEAE